MYIQRVQVEEGFLDGLDVNFSPGLNVIIGARGTGKTSLIELIRFCLDVPGGPDIARRSRDHALSVLSSGQITVTINNQGEQIYVSRTAGDLQPRVTGSYKKPMVFSQTEIETIGLESAGRLRLIDAFLGATNFDSTNEDKLAAEIRSITTEVDRIRREIEELDRQQKQKPVLLEELKINEAAKATVAKSSELLNAKTAALADLSKNVSRASVIYTETARAKNVVAAWYHEINAVLESPNGKQVDEEKQLELYAVQLKQVRLTLTQSIESLASIYHQLNEAEKSHLETKLGFENSARQIRAEVEGLQSGAGQVMRKSLELAEKIANIDAMAMAHLNKNQHLDSLLHKRASLLEALDGVRRNRFEQRTSTIRRLNAELGPNIRVQISKNGQHPIFAAALADALRGSGVKYAEIVCSIAESISPRALLEAIDNFDVELISETTGITFERASRILTHLRSCDLGTLSTVNIEDEVSFQLLDGREYKDIKDLSTGQRCTVILPLVLAHHERILIVDQPEDHIDNAFIAGTLIKSVLARTNNSQIVFSTHNPNIPVLGNADTVLHMGSDGRRGFALCEGPLGNADVVAAISTVMEGGAEAFSRRADFYESVGLT